MANMGAVVLLHLLQIQQLAQTDLQNTSFALIAQYKIALENCCKQKLAC